MYSLTSVILVLFPSVLILCRTAKIRPLHDVYIVNPNYTDVSNYNYTVAVLNKNQLLGGGVLINRRWVLTAAYNTDGFMPSDLRVRVSSNSPTSGGRLYRVNKIKQHPQYSANWTNNLALLYLGWVVSPGVATPIALAKKPFAGQAATVLTGYEPTGQRAGLMSGGLQVADLQMYDYATCDQKWYGTELSAGEVCGYSPGVGPCWSDFGDPVVTCDSGHLCTLVATFSGSYGCADDHYPGIYMDIGRFYSWIIKNAK